MLKAIIFEYRLISLLVLLYLTGLHPVLGATTGLSQQPKTSQSSNSHEQVRQRSEEARKYYNLALKFGRANLFRQAAELCRRAIELKPDYKDAYFQLGRAYDGLGQWEDSIQAYEHVLLANPSDKKALTALVIARQRQREQNRTVLSPKQSVPVGERINLQISASTKEEVTAATPSAISTDSLLEVYKVGAGDVLEIRLPEPLTSNGTSLFTVTANGFIEHPSLDQPVQVSQLTTQEIGQRLRERLRQGAASGDIDVSVAVREYNSHIVLVSGLVKDPGPKILRREAIPLYVVLADAQVLPEASEVTVVFRRENTPLTLAMAEGRISKALIQPGDVITVQAAPSQYFYVGGEVKSPGEKQFRTGLTLTQAILAAGGATARGKKVELRRQDNAGSLATTNYRIKDIDSGKLPDVEIQPGDRILVIN